MYASPMDFILPYIGGIENVGIGFDHVRFAPYLYSEDCASHYAVKTKYGKISINWEYKNGIFKAKIKKPTRVRATLFVFSEEREITEAITEIEIKQ